MSRLRDTPMHIHFIVPRWEKLLEAHPELATTLSGYRVGHFTMIGNGAAAAAGAMPAGHTVTLADEHAAPLDFGLRPDLVALSYFTPQASRAHAIAARFRAAGVPVIAGGIHPSMAPDDCRPHVDALVRGPVEGLWPAILADLAAGRLQAEYHGRPDASFAQPRRDLFASSDYLRAGVVQVARGCDRRCHFCIVPDTYGSRISYRPVSAVVDDIASLQFGCFFFGDENLLFPGSEHRDYRQELFTRLREAGLRKVSFVAAFPRFLRDLTAEDIAALAAAGCRQLYLITGLMQPLVEELPEPALITAVNLCRAARIETLATFTLGHDEDPPEVEEPIAGFCQAIGANLAEFTIATPFPGTSDFARLAAAGRLHHRDFRRYNGAHVVFEPRHQSAGSLANRYRALWQRFYGSLDRFTVDTRYLKGFGRDIFHTSR